MKTDRRDAEKLARCYRAGDLTPIWVPTPEHEAQNINYSRFWCEPEKTPKQDQLRARHRLSKFLCRHGMRPPGDD